jgi:hypothetical protein
MTDYTDSNDTTKTVMQLIQKEQTRQREGLELIPSENYVSSDVLTALGSVFTNKYSEGYPWQKILWWSGQYRSTRAVGDRQSKTVVWRRPCQRTTPQWRSSQYRGVPSMVAARGHGYGHEARPRWALDTWASCDF